MGNEKENSSKNFDLAKKVEDQANTIARLENDIKKLGDVNASPRIIQRGNQTHPHFEKNNIKIAATLPKEKPEQKLKK